MIPPSLELASNLLSVLLLERNGLHDFNLDIHILAGLPLDELRVFFLSVSNNSLNDICVFLSASKLYLWLEKSNQSLYFKARVPAR